MKDILNLLEFIDLNSLKGEFFTPETLQKKGFDINLIKRCETRKLITVEEGKYVLEPVGHNLLRNFSLHKNTRQLKEIMADFNKSSKDFNKSAEESNKQMIGLGKWNLRFFAISILISFFALFLSFNIGYGGARLEWEYSVSGHNDKFFYYDDTIMLEFIIKNGGFSSTLYNVEPIVDCSISNCSVEISFDGEEPFEKISKPKIKSIEAKSGQFVMVIIRNIPPEQVGKEFTVLVRDLKTNKHNYIKFKRGDDDLTKLLIESLYKSQNG